MEEGQGRIKIQRLQGAVEIPGVGLVDGPVEPGVLGHRFQGKPESRQKHHSDNLKEGSFQVRPGAAMGFIFLSQLGFNRRVKTQAVGTTDNGKLNSD